MHLAGLREGAGVGGRGGGRMLGAAEGAASVSAGPGLFEEMLAGGRRQQQARRLSGPLIGMRERVVRRFAASAGGWPWQWTAAQAESWLASGGVGALDGPGLPGRAEP